MSLDIQFLHHYSKKQSRSVESFELEPRNDDKDWFLPEVVLVPGDGLPHIKKVSVGVRGTPPLVVQKLQNLYTTNQFLRPLALTERYSLNPYLLVGAGALPVNAQCEMTVTVLYQASDAHGRPTGPDIPLTKKCLLFSGEKKVVLPELLPQPSELTIVPDEPATLMIEVNHPRTDKAPQVRLEHLQTVLDPVDPLGPQLQSILPTLRENLVQTLKLTPVRSDRRDNTDVYTVTYLLKLPQETRNFLSEIEAPILVPTLIEYPEARGKQLLVRLTVKKHLFQGFLVIDFGTTNSTVTVHEVRDQKVPNGLPAEQEQALRRALFDWLKRSPSEALPNGRQTEDAWRDWLRLTAQTLNLEAGDLIADQIRNGTDADLYSAVVALEQNLRDITNETFRRVVGVKLHGIIHGALREPSFSRRNIYPLKIDQVRKDFSVQSDIEVIEVQSSLSGDGTNLRVKERMGNEVVQARQAELSAGEDIDRMNRRYLPSPKRCFGTAHPPIEVEAAGTRGFASVDALMRGGWKALIDLAGKVQASDPDMREGPFGRVVVTYPTVAPPSVRQRIPELLRDLGLIDIRTDYDEAVSAAIFYLFREYGGFAEIGLEAFKARTRLAKRGQNCWVQNVLVFDIGGGTTDVALIELTLSEEFPFDAGDNRGAGGRYYKMTPKLLSSTGNTRLGGEIMTLRVFQLLKALIADRVLTLVQSGKLKMAVVEEVLSKYIPEEATDKSKKYAPGWLPKMVLQAKDNDSQSRTALDVINHVIPTRWRQETEKRFARLQAFYDLWNYAEEAKKELGGRSEFALEARPSFRLSDDKVLDLLRTCHGDNEVQTATEASGRASAEFKKQFQIELTVQQMEIMLTPIVQNAVNYAVGAAQRLQNDVVDWLILSGQSCHLDLVHRLIRETLQKKAHFIWNQERVTFVPKYAKLSTSMGAALAETYRRIRANPKASKNELRSGVNVVHFDIQNLFHFLPCDFLLDVGEGVSPRLFEAHLEFREVDYQTQADAVGKARSEWIGARVQYTVLRRDFAESDRVPWGQFVGQDVINKLQGLNENIWRERYNVQFEVDHRLGFDVLVCKFDLEKEQPHYRIRDKKAEPALDLKAELNKLTVQQAKKQVGEVSAKPETPVALLPLFADNRDPRTLQWEIGWAAPGSTKFLPLFQAKRCKAIKLHTGSADTEAVKDGLLSLDTVRQDRDHKEVTIYGYPTDSKDRKAVKLGTLDLPERPPEFQRLCRLTLDEDGILRSHCGEPGYWESNDMQVLLRNPGCVYRTRLEPTKQDSDEIDNPFSGTH